MLKRTISHAGIILTPPKETREGIMFYRIKYMIFLVMKIPDLILNTTIVISGFWAAAIFGPWMDLAPLVTIIVPVGIHILKYFDDRKVRRQQTQMQERIEQAELKLEQVEKEKVALRAELNQFQSERGEFRGGMLDKMAQVCETVAEISAKVDAKNE